jgi:hypothetical protein
MDESGLRDQAAEDSRLAVGVVQREDAKPMTENRKNSAVDEAGC